MAASSSQGRSAKGKSEQLSAAEAAQTGLRQLAELIGKEATGVTSVAPDEDGWRIGVEVVEDRRVPSSTDMLALYELHLDEDGTLLGYDRTRRYSRGSGKGEEGP